MPHSGFHWLLARVFLHVSVFACACSCSHCCVFRVVTHPALFLNLFSAFTDGLSSLRNTCRMQHAGYGFLPWLSGFRNHVLVFPPDVVCTISDRRRNMLIKSLDGKTKDIHVLGSNHAAY